MNLVAQGFDLMLVGMGSVFAFLILLIGTLQVMSQLIMRFVPEQKPAFSARLDTADPSGEEIAAIAAAITVHRQKF